MTERQRAAAAEPDGNEKYAADIESKARAVSDQHEAAETALKDALCALNALDLEGADDEGEIKEGTMGSKLKGLVHAVFAVNGIRVQRYWMGSLVGNDCRRLLEKQGTVLEQIKMGIIAAGFGEEEATGFVERHPRGMAPLEVLSRGMRRTEGAGPGGLLSAKEMAELKVACAEFGAGWRESYHRPPTPKAHVIEVHVPWFIDIYHICGIFGEDGAESKHVTDSSARKKVRSMQDAKARFSAHTRHSIVQDYTPGLARTIHRRQSKKKKAAAALLQQAIGALPVQASWGAHGQGGGGGL